MIARRKQPGTSSSPDSEGGGAEFAVGASFLSLTAAGILMLSLGSAESGDMALLFPPWTTFEEVAVAVGEADGRLVRTGAFENVVVVHSAAPDFKRNIRNAGAWAIFHPLIFGGCLFTTGEPSPVDPAGDR